MSLRVTSRRARLAIASCLGLCLGLPAFAGSISTVDVDGRKVFVNDEEQPKYVAADGHPTESSRTLIFWSSTEHRWKPVPHANPRALDAARSAAAEVKNFVASQPHEAAASTQAADKDPNFGKMVRGFSVSSKEVEDAISEAATRHGVDANLVKAIIKVESNFNPRALSNKGAMGLMQLMPGTARQFKVSNPFDVRQNVDAGVQHFRRLLQDFNGDVSLSLAAYNAGERAVTSHGGVPPYRETQSYVRQITQLYNGGVPITSKLAPVRTPIKVYRDDQGVLTFNNVD